MDIDNFALHTVSCFSLSTEEEALPWEIRVKIAIGTAQGLAFLHSIKNTPLHLEQRMHSIMLDDVQYNAKLLYLETNKRFLEDETFVGRREYVPPEFFLMSGSLAMENDVLHIWCTLIHRCTKRDKKKRPLMQQVLDVLNSIADIKS